MSKIRTIDPSFLKGLQSIGFGRSGLVGAFSARHNLGSPSVRSSPRDLGLEFLKAGPSPS